MTRPAPIAMAICSQWPFTHATPMSQERCRSSIGLVAAALAGAALGGAVVAAASRDKVTSGPLESGSGGLKQHRGGGRLLQIGQKSAFVTRKIARRARQRPDRHRTLVALLPRRYHHRMDIGDRQSCLQGRRVAV